jgi:formylglycine-generating enzyme required for sulfatase activity
LPFTPEVRALVATSIIDPVDNIFLLTVGTPFRTTDPVTGKVNDGPAHISQPGRKTGYGRWGHADMTGNVLEYLLDVTPIPLAPCVDCARVDFADPPQDQVGYYPPNWYLGAPDKDNEADFPDGRRSLRGGSWDIHVLVTTYRYHYRIYNTYYAAGGRCARD